MAGARGSGRLSALLGWAAFCFGGLVLGLIVGVVSEEPELVMGHVTGHSAEVGWRAADGASEPPAEPERVAAAPSGEQRPRARPAESASLPSVAAGPPGVHAPAARAGDAAAEVYAIQVGAFSEARSAEKVAATLRGKGYPVKILEPASDARWRVRVAPVEGHDQALSLERKLKQQERLPTWVLRERG